MDRKQRQRLSVKLSWLLRHGAGKEGLPMDAAGWAPIEAVCAAMRMSREALDALTVDNSKNRYEVHDGKVRASQGHSLDGMPVTREALEATWAPFEGDDRVWHGTRVDAVASIARDGIHPASRTHVHLAAALDSSVGKRNQVAVMLGVSVARLRARDIEVFISPNGVVLAREVPADCIDELELISRRARQQADALRACFALVT